MKKQWMFMALMLALVVASCAAMPVMAEQMIASSADRVMTETVTAMGPEAAPEDVKRAVTKDRTELMGYPLSERALEELEVKARGEYERVFGEKIPSGHAALDTLAYEDEGDMRCSLSLMPANWEESTGTLNQGTDECYYSFTFGGVDVDTGAATLLGMQRFRLTFDKNEAVDVQYTTGQIEAMEEAARVFAEEQGMNPGKLIATDKVSGSFMPGCVLVFDLGNEKTVSVTVSAEGEVSGYSLVLAKG